MREKKREKKTLRIAKLISFKKGVDKSKVWYYNWICCARKSVAEK